MGVSPENYTNPTTVTFIPASPFKTAMDAYLKRHNIPNAPQKEPANAK